MLAIISGYHVNKNWLKKNQSSRKEGVVGDNSG